MKIIVYILTLLIGLTAVNAVALAKTTIKKKGKVESKKITQVDPANVFGIGYPTITVAINSIKERKDIALKANNKPFGWQERTGPWYVVKEDNNIEWAFTEGGHYAHPTVVKRVIEIGATHHLSVDMAFRCEAVNRADCKKLFTEFNEVNKLISKVYQKKFITSPDGVAVWNGVDSLD